MVGGVQCLVFSLNWFINIGKGNPDRRADPRSLLALSRMCTRQTCCRIFLKGWGSGPLGAARPFHFFSRLGLFWRFGTFGFWASRRRSRAPPLKPPGSSNRKPPYFYRQFFFQKKFGANFFLAILTNNGRGGRRA